MVRVKISHDGSVLVHGRSKARKTHVGGQKSWWGKNIEDPKVRERMWMREVEAKCEYYAPAEVNMWKSVLVFINKSGER